LWVLNGGIPSLTPVTMAAVLNAVARARTMTVDVRYEYGDKASSENPPPAHIVARHNLVRIAQDVQSALIDVSTGKKMSFIKVRKVAKLNYVSPGEYDVLSRIRQL